MTEPVLQLSGARFGYGGVDVVRGDLRVNAGEALAVFGSNGSGKSTLIKGALGIVDCHGGDVEWFGHRLGRGMPRQRIGYVPQTQPGVSTVPATVAEVVRVGVLRRGRLFGRGETKSKEAVANAIAAVGLTGFERRQVAQLSGGQQRRVLMARALVGDTDVLMLDEPFSGVDHSSQEDISAVLGSLNDRGITLVIVLHEPGPLARVISREVHIVDRVVTDECTAQP